MTEPVRVPADLLAIMQCIVCGGGLVEEVEKAHRLRCTECDTRYPVDDHGVPVMLIEEAERP